MKRNKQFLHALTGSRISEITPSLLVLHVKDKRHYPNETESRRDFKFFENARVEVRTQE